MAEFIEVHCNGESRFVNLKWIEEVRNDERHGCTIYLSFSCPNACDQDYIIADESYDEVKRMILKDQ